MKVGIDVTELAGPRPGGVRTALRLLLAALRDHAPDIEPWALAPLPVPLPDGVLARWTRGPERTAAWRRSGALRRGLRGLDLFFSPVTAHPRRLPVPLVTTVHELPFVTAPRLVSTRRAVADYLWVSRALAASATVVVPSEATAEQVTAVHPAAPRRLRVVPHPAPVVPDGPPPAPDGSLLFVGRLEPRKGVGALLAAARHWPGEVRLVGPAPPAQRRLAEQQAAAHGVAGRLRILGPVDDGRLDAYYRRANVVALPSVSEGFGFPVLEALGRGVPVVVGRATGAAATGGEAALVVDPADPDAFAAALRRADGPEHRALVARAGPERLAAFPAERTAHAYREIFADALARRRDRVR